jgi:alpha-mannosidase
MLFQPSKTTLQEITKFAENIEQSICEPVADLQVTAWKSTEPVPYAERESGAYVALSKGDKWGDLFDCAWFRFMGRVPVSAQGEEVVLLIDLSGELLVVDVNGAPDQGLTTAASFYDFSLGRPGKRVYYPPKPLKPGDAIDLWADAGNNDLFGMLQNNGTVQEACIAILHQDRVALLYDYTTLLDLMQQLSQGSARYHKILFALWSARQELTSFARDRVGKARSHLAKELGKKGGDPSLRFAATGHAHLDLAWLWPMRETLRKGARTFSHVLKMMERYPEFRFAASQAQLYQWMKEHYPDLFARIKTMIAEGRWDAAAPSWVEFDTNLPWGEALVRQFLYGKQFTRREFGVDARVLLLPDSFGYNGALPQLMKKAGIEYFITTKMSWDRYTTFPHHTFHWEGIDGSRVLAHMPPEGTYNSPVTPRVILLAEREYLDKAVSEDALLLFGIGDGGGGPAVEHLERLIREKNLDGLPPVQQTTLVKFMERLEKGRVNYAVWHGELFLACHQGTFTTQGRIKYFNRRMEVGLRNVELLASIAGTTIGVEYPGEFLVSVWKDVLLLQFHDILPGSSIKRVYQEADDRYAALIAEVTDRQRATEGHIVDAIDTHSMTRPCVIFNPLSWERNAWVDIKGMWFLVQVGPMGYRTINISDPPTLPNLKSTPKTIEHDLLKVSFHEDGSIASILDKQFKREVIAAGALANQLVVYDDRGDAWDFSWDYEYRVAGRFTLTSANASVEGGRAVIAQHYSYGSSTLDQRIMLTAGSRRIDFETVVDWQESGKMLRALFPVNVQATEVACEIQFGHVMRPTHRNTSREMGMYEIPAQKWIDLSQRNYGVALLKECKYGHKVQGNIIDIDLLRSPSYPDPTADRGRHEFTYALYPHAGDHITGGVVRAAYEFNYPLIPHLTATHPGALPQAFSLVRLDAANVIIESIKQAEDGKGLVLRLYEAHGIDAAATLSFGVPVTKIVTTNLLEEYLADVKMEGETAKVAFKPFEIVTLRLEV